MKNPADLRVVFMGSPEFALPSLSALVESYHVVGVITQPDRPAGRGRAITQPPIKQLAVSLEIPVIQPVRLREPPAMDQLHAWAPDLIVVVAFGQILRLEVLDLPRYGCINVHASLLPRWRGAAPIQAAILSGDQKTGVTIMRMDAGVDTGPILSQRSLSILVEDTAASLSQRLSTLGAHLLKDTLQAYIKGDLSPQPQPESGATYAPLLKKEEGLLDFTQPAIILARKVRALNPWPGAYTFWNDKLLKIHLANPANAHTQHPGARLVYNGYPAISTTEGILILEQVQPAGKKPMPGDVFLQGARGWSD